MTQDHVDKDDPWSGVLGAAAFVMISTLTSLKGYCLGKFVFGRDMILPIEHTVDWELTCQRNQTQINKYNIHENRNQVDQDYNVGDKAMLNNHAAYKYETSYKGPFVITWFLTNGTVNMQYGQTEIRHNIRRINPYKSDTKVGDINPKKCVMMSTYYQ